MERSSSFCAELQHPRRQRCLRRLSVRPYIGAGEGKLHLGAKISAPPNPFNGNGTEYAYTPRLFLTKDGEDLESPSDYLGVTVNYDYGSSMLDGYWNGESWKLQDFFADEADYSSETPTKGRRAYGYNREDGMHIEVHIPWSSSRPGVDGLQLESGSTFRLALGFVVQDPQGGALWDIHSDTWPGDGPTRSETDPSSWLRLHSTAEYETVLKITFAPPPEGTRRFKLWVVNGDSDEGTGIVAAAWEV